MQLNGLVREENSGKKREEHRVNLLSFQTRRRMYFFRPQFTMGKREDFLCVIFVSKSCAFIVGLGTALMLTKKRGEKKQEKTPQPKTKMKLTVAVETTVSSLPSEMCSYSRCSTVWLTKPSCSYLHNTIGKDTQQEVTSGGH